MRTDRVPKAIEVGHQSIGRAQLAAAVLGATVRTVRRWRRRGLLPPAIRLGGALRWAVTDVLAWPESRRGATPDAATPVPAGA